MASEKVTEKARRLLDEGKVTPIHHDATVGVFSVVGDTGNRLVLIMADELRERAQRLNTPPGSCTCEARSVCSHLLACHATFKALNE